MKKIYTMMAGILLCAGLVSCEMKNEIFGNENVPEETGYVELGVSVNDKTNVVVTKADENPSSDGDIQGSNVDPSDYPVVFTHQTVTDYTKEFVYGDIEGTSVALPVGAYKVSVHTPGELQKQMTAPYYGGEADLEVTQDIPTTAKVVCTMQNSRILLTYGADFTTKFSEWTITIDDGSDKTLVFTNQQGSNPDAVYWYFGENCSSITIDITGKTTKGAPISESRTITKPDGAADSNWTGGDALTITMEPGPDNVDPENPSGVSGIKITVDAFFETEKEEMVEVPIEDGETTEPGDGDEEEGDGGDDTPSIEDPSITSDYLASGISFTITKNPEWTGPGVMDQYKVVNAPSNAVVSISAANGFREILVRINAQGGFYDAISVMGLQNNVNILASDLDETLKSILNPPTDPNATTYSLDVAGFFSMMAWYGPTAPDTYDFIITVTDKNGNTAGPETLSVTISEE